MPTRNPRAEHTGRNTIRMVAAAAEKPDVVELTLYGEVGAGWWDEGNSAIDLHKTLAENPKAPIVMYINSGGGDLFEGVSMHSMLMRHQGDVTMSVDGMAASAASLVMMAGKTREISPGAMVMIHNASTAAWGNAAELERQVGLLHKSDGQMVGIYAAATGQSEDDIRAAMDAETYYTAAEALEFGLATTLSERPAITANFDPGKFKNAPKLLLQQLQVRTEEHPKMPSKKPEATDEESVKNAERARVLAIQSAGLKLEVPATDVEAAINGDMTADAFRKVWVEAYAAKPQPADKILDTGRPNIDMGADASEKWRDRAVAGLVHQMQHKPAEAGEAGRFQAMGFQRLARVCLEHAGMSPDNDRMRMVGQAFTMHTAGGYQGRDSFPLILDDVIRQMVLDRSELDDMVWSRFCSIGNMIDYRPHYRLRMGEMGVWAEVKEGAEYKNVPLPDGRREVAQLKKYGEIISVTREMMVNDDMDSLTKQINAFTDAGMYTVEALVFALLALNGGLGPNMSDGNPLFDAAHKNIGASAALSVASLQADRVLMRRQKDDRQKRALKLRPRILVIAPELHGEAVVINEAQWDNDTGVPAEKPNKVRGMYTDLVDAAELEGTRRYSFEDPNRYPTIEVGFMDNRRVPELESNDGFRIDGVEYKGRQEVSVAAVGYKGATTNAGA